VNNRVNIQEAKVIVALDFDDQIKALRLVDQLDPSMCKLKVGKEMFSYFGPAFVKTLVTRGFDVFLDLKFHDIPNTVAKACLACAELGVWMLNVHASGGQKMMEAAVQALQDFGTQRPLLIGVTVLTSMDSIQLKQVGIDSEPDQQVLKLSNLTQNAGLDGVVCSAQEAKLLRKDFDRNFKLVTPGIRPVGSDLADQSRVMTPIQAITAGADYLVVGRPITQSDDPLAVLQQINASLPSTG
jgi:orotidine-5'-phosphate decarboxylase